MERRRGGSFEGREGRAEQVMRPFPCCKTNQCAREGITDWKLERGKEAGQKRRKEARMVRLRGVTEVIPRGISPLQGYLVHKKQPASPRTTTERALGKVLL